MDLREKIYDFFDEIGEANHGILPLVFIASFIATIVIAFLLVSFLAEPLLKYYDDPATGNINKWFAGGGLVTLLVAICYTENTKRILVVKLKKYNEKFNQLDDLFNNQCNYIKMLLAKDMEKTSVKMFNWFSSQFKNTHLSANFIQTINGIAAEGATSIVTSQVSGYYRDHPHRPHATDFLCVIYAAHTTEFLKKDTFCEQISYYRGFDEKNNPRDRVVRVFSVPATYRRGTWVFATEFTIDMRQRLAAFLLINAVLGVDTYFHVFNEARPNDHILQTADYVLCKSPTAKVPSDRQIVFIAKPNDELNCLKVVGHSEVCNVFQYDFYSRFDSGFNGAQDDDMILNVVKYKWNKIVAILAASDTSFVSGLSDTIANAIDECINDEIVVCGLPWTNTDKDRVASKLVSWLAYKHS